MSASGRHVGYFALYPKYLHEDDYDSEEGEYPIIDMKVIELNCPTLSFYGDCPFTSVPNRNSEIRLKRLAAYTWFLQFEAT